MLEEIGLEGRRVQMINISSAMGGQFAFAAAEITAEIKRIGPNPLRRVIVSSADAEIDPAREAEEEVAVSDTPDLRSQDPA